jgi:hypothetical protein
VVLLTRLLYAGWLPVHIVRLCRAWLYEGLCQSMQGLLSTRGVSRAPI